MRYSDLSYIVLTMNTQPKAFHDLPFLSIDTETTGIDPYTDRIVTVSMVVTYPESMNRVPLSKEILINPGIDIAEAASAVHGITNEKAQAEGVDPVVGLTEIAEALTRWDATGNPVVIFNSAFDATLLRSEFARHAIPYTGEFKRVIDPFVLDRYTDKWRKGKRTLETVATLYGVTLDDAHNASADALAAAEVLRRMGIKYNDKLGNLTPEQMFTLQQNLKREQAISFQKYLAKTEPEAFIPTGWPFRTPETDAADRELYSK